MATYVAHTSHYEAVPEALASRYLAPWLRRRRVMANTLRIKCILSLSRPDGTDATAPYRLRRGRVIPDPPSSPPLSIFLLLFLFSPFLPFSFSFFFFFLVSPPYTGKFEASPPFSTDRRRRLRDAPAKRRTIAESVLASSGHSIFLLLLFTDRQQLVPSRNYKLWQRFTSLSAIYFLRLFYTLSKTNEKYRKNDGKRRPAIISKSIRTRASFGEPQHERIGSAIASRRAGWLPFCSYWQR